MPLLDLSEIDNSVLYWENSRCRVSFFITKLWLIVNDPYTNDIVHWNDDGLSFKIRNQQRFCSEVLPRYFKHSNMNSFIRQLNMYGFRKISFSQNSGLAASESEDFAHPCFIRGQEAYISFIKRRTPECRYGPSTICCKLDELYSFYESLKINHDLFRSEVDALKRSKVGLLAAIKDLRQKHIHQEQIIQKLISFIVTLLPRCSEVNLKRNSQLMIDGPPLSPHESKRLRPEANGVKINEILDDKHNAPLALDDVETNGSLSTFDTYDEGLSRNSLSLCMENSLLNLKKQNFNDVEIKKKPSPCENSLHNISVNNNQSLECIAVNDLKCLVDANNPELSTNNLKCGTSSDTASRLTNALNDSERDKFISGNFMSVNDYHYLKGKGDECIVPHLSNECQSSLDSNEGDSTLNTASNCSSENVFSSECILPDDDLHLFYPNQANSNTVEDVEKVESQHSSDIFSWNVIDWVSESFDK